MERFAIYGGSFDPVHEGHIALANAAAEELGLDRVIFMPNGVSPFKRGEQISPAKDRSQMLSLILPRNPAFALSHYELRQGKSMYTIDTLREMQRILPGTGYFLLGFDAMETLSTWYRGEEILRRYPILTACRPGTAESTGRRRIAQYAAEYGADITVLHLEPCACSSTEIRRKAAAGETLDGLVDPAVARYIRQRGLYREKGRHG